MARTRGAFIEIDFDWKKFEVSYRRKKYNVEQVGYNEQVLHDIAKRYANLIDPWVPYKTGQLSKFSIEEGGRIIYDPVSTKRNGRDYHYAAVQYDNDFPNRNRKKHPLATSHWDEVADQYIWDEFRKDAAKIIRDKLKEEE